MRLNVTTYNVLKMLGEWEIPRPYNFLLLPMVDQLFGHAFNQRLDEKILLVCPFSSKQDQWFYLECINVHDGKKYKMVDCKRIDEISNNVVFPSQFARLLIEYQENFVRKLIRDIPVKRNSHNEFVRWLQSYESGKQTSDPE